MTGGDGIEGLVRSVLVSQGAYSPGKAAETLAREIGVAAEDVIKLDANENVYGCSPRVNRALASYPYLNIYPDATQTRIRGLLADYAGIGAEYIVAGNGSDQLIDFILDLLIEPGDEVVNCVPTFAMFGFRTKLHSGTLVEVPRDEDYAVDVDAVKKAITKRTKLILLATPNNPTGTITSQKDILELVDTGVPVLVDEAYVEFSGETVTRLVSQYKNMMVMRTFSKWAGLAGIRIGYGVFPPRIAQYLMTIKLPYNVNAAALVAVEESLKDLDYLLGNVKAIVAERERLFEELKKLKFLKPFPSKANFVFCAVLKGKASEIQRELEKKGILVRYFDLPLLRNSLRISAGRPEHTDAVIEALREIGDGIDEK
jgi:histidinol-phosphate aminotransferase